MRRYDDIEKPLPPIRPSEIQYSLQLVEGLPPQDSNWKMAKLVAETVADPEARLRAHAPAADWIWENYGRWTRSETETDRTVGDSFDWRNGWRRVPYELLEPVFSFEELMKLRHGEVIMSTFGEWFDVHHPFLRKILFAHWHYGCDNDWNMLVRHLEGFKRIAIDLPDFEVKIVHTRSINQCAWAYADGLRDLYLDASFGLLIYYKGEHVLTVGFAPCRYGVLVAQAQLRRHKGNRFLFKLPRHYLDIGLDILSRAFADEPIWLINGESSVEATLQNYGGAITTIDKEVADRMTSLYNRPLEAFRRGPESIKQDNRTFVRLYKAA